MTSFLTEGEFSPQKVESHTRGKGEPRVFLRTARARTAFTRTRTAFGRTRVFRPPAGEGGEEDALLAHLLLHVAL